MWWWIIPMLKTGGLCFIIAMAFASIFFGLVDDDTAWPAVVFFILLIPLLVGIAGLIVWLFIEIWRLFI